MGARSALAAALIGLAAVSAGAQPGTVPAIAVPVPNNVLHLSASAAVDVLQDLLTLSLSTTREGPDPAALQAQLKAAVDAALAEARKVAQPGQLEVRTGSFALMPRYGRDGRMTGWSGSAEVLLEGRDMARITQTAGRIGTLTVAGVAFSLSREQRTRAEDEAQAQAIARFQARAAELAKGFGFGGYTLREVAVNAGDPGPVPRPRMMAMQARGEAADASVPVEAGKATVSVNVSGSVQLR